MPSSGVSKSREDDQPLHPGGDPSSQHVEESAPYHVKPFPISHLEGAGCSNLNVEGTPHSTRGLCLWPVACRLLANSGKMRFRDLRTISLSFNPGGIPVVPCAHPIQGRF